MSAIAGVLRLDGAPDAEINVRTMMAAFPDLTTRVHVWAPSSGDHRVALARRPLWGDDGTVPGLGAPLCSPDGRVVIVGDARIDNRTDLVRQLRLDGAESRLLTDSALILPAYVKWGSDCVRHLIGDFAFLLYDVDRRIVFGARDGMGQRVLFLHASDRRIAVASSPFALLAMPDVSASLNRRRVGSALVLLQDPGATYFEGIERLGPGESIEISQSGVRRSIFWRPDSRATIRFRSDAEYVDAFMEIFGEAVRCRIDRQQPTGVLLSAGLDSTAVAVLAAQALAEHGEPLHAFHAAPAATFDGRSGRGMVADEARDVAAVVAPYPNIRLRIDRSPQADGVWDVEDLFRRVGAPTRNPNNWGWFRSQFVAAQQAGIRVMLNGNMGNGSISYSGIRSLREAARRGEFGILRREAIAIARATERSVWSTVRDQVVLPLAPLPIERAYRRHLGRRPVSLRDRTLSPIREDQAQLLGLDDVARSFGRAEDQLRRCRGVDLRILTLTGGGDTFDILNSLRAWYGIESRDPTADTRLIDFCLAIPEWQYRSGDQQRWLVRRAMRGRVTDAVLDRRTYGAQGADWMDWLHLLRPRIVETLADLERSETARTFLDLPMLHTLVDRWPNRFGPEHEGAYKLRLLRGIMMGRFLRWFERTYG